jgi:1,4-alpha-glucan branching enzyme
MIRRRAKGENVRLTFAIPQDAFPGAVSVVGDFNGWTPGAHPLKKRSNGTRSATVAVTRGSVYRFRYLGEGGAWFDDTDADAMDHAGGLVLA